SDVSGLALVPASPEADESSPTPTGAVDDFWTRQQEAREVVQSAAVAGLIGLPGGGSPVSTPAVPRQTGLDLVVPPLFARATATTDISQFLVRENAPRDGQITSDPGNPSGQLGNFLKTPLSFEANHGQTDARVQFLSRGPGYSLFLTSDEAVLSLQQTVA